tara:strand:+ start:224 stop:445 length:222 start_codon:yes stop_codon:yes gene_type:complete
MVVQVVVEEKMVDLLLVDLVIHLLLVRHKEMVVVQANLNQELEEVAVVAVLVLLEEIFQVIMEAQVEMVYQLQ